MAWMKVAPGFLGRTAADLFHPLFMEMLGNTGDAGATALQTNELTALFFERLDAYRRRVVESHLVRCGLCSIVSDEFCNFVASDSASTSSVY
jgi:hypothetical protein